MTDQTPATEPPKTDPHRIELIQSEDGRDYSLRSRPEILGVLRSMIERGSLMTAYFNQGTDFLMTSLLKIADDSRTLWLDVGSNGEMNKRALASDRLICVSNLDKVKIQFVLNGVDAVQFEGRAAFLANTPDSVMRLQRRDYYRLAMPVLHPLKCTIPTKSYDGSSQSIEVNVIDISGGGVGFVAKTDGVELSTDMLLPDCRIELPGIGVIVVTMRIRSVYEVTLRTGARHKRAGCQFIDLPNQQQTLLQRFIIKAERERKARESGLG